MARVRLPRSGLPFPMSHLYRALVRSSQSQEVRAGSSYLGLSGMKNIEMIRIIINLLMNIRKGTSVAEAEQLTRSGILSGLCVRLSRDLALLIGPLTAPANARTTMVHHCQEILQPVYNGVSTRNSRKAGSYRMWKFQRSSQTSQMPSPCLWNRVKQVLSPTRE